MEEVVIHCQEPFTSKYNVTIPNVNIAYEAWGTLNSKKDNVVLVQHGLSASAHAKSHEVSLKSYYKILKLIFCNLAIMVMVYFLNTINH